MIWPKVSIVIPVYNGENFLNESLESATAQTYPNLEIVVIDDGSDDRLTGEIAADFVGRHPQKIRYMRKANGGVGSALNAGISLATGSFFSWLSHDDAYEVDKIETQVRYHRLLRRRDAVVFSDYDIVDERGRTIEPIRLPHGLFRQAPLSPLITGAINGCTLLIPMHLLRENGPFKEELRYTQDYDLWHDLTRAGVFFHQAKSLVRFRSHTGQGSREAGISPEGNSLWRKMVDDYGPTERAMVHGSSWRFYEQTRLLLEPSPYQDAYQYVLGRRDTCLVETLVSLILIVEEGWDERAAELRVLPLQSHAHIELILVVVGRSPRRAKAVGGAGRGHTGLPVNEADLVRLNTALEQARGEYIIVAESSAPLAPDTVRMQLEQTAKRGRLVSITTETTFPDDADEVLWSELPLLVSRQDREAAARATALPFHTLMLHRCLRAAGARFVESSAFRGKYWLTVSATTSVLLLRAE